MDVTLYSLAARHVGVVRELPGDRHHPAIQWWLHLAGFDAEAPDEIPWCGAFIAGMAWLLDLPIPATPARARSWLTVGTPIALDEAVIGFDVVILSRGAPPAGHVGIYAGRDGDRVRLIGGNQTDAVTVARFAVERVLGVRRLG